MMDAAEPQDVDTSHLAPPDVYPHLRVIVQSFDILNRGRPSEFAPNGIKFPKPFTRSDMLNEANELGLLGRAREDFLRILRMCDDIHLEGEYEQISLKLKEQKNG